MNRLVRLTPLLILLVAFLGWETYQAWIAPPTPDLPLSTASGVAASDNASASAPAAALAAAVAEVVARPLLRPDRQPFKEVLFVAAVPQRNYEGELSRFSILGVLPIDGKERALIVRKGPGVGDERWELAPGESLPGFVAKAIRQDGVLLEADGKEFLLPLYGGGPKPGGSGPMRTEVSAGPAIPPAQPAHGVPGATVVPRGVLPGAVPINPAFPQGYVPPPSAAPLGQYGVPAPGHVRTRRPPVMPSRPQFVAPVP